MLGEHPADRLDPEPVPVGVDERHYFLDWRSSSAPKKADAAFKISFARRSSRFSRSSSRIRARSSVVSPGRWPASVSARRTHWRSVSWLMLSFAEIDSIAFPCEEYSSWCSNTIRTARLRTSSGYRPGRRFDSGICSSSQGDEQSPIPGRFGQPSGDAIAEPSFDELLRDLEKRHWSGERRQLARAVNARVRWS